MIQKMGIFIKKAISILLLLSFLQFSCFSAEPYQSTVQSNLTNLEQLMTDLQNSSIERQILVQDLQKQLESANQSVDNLTNQVDEISQISEQHSKLLKKQEKQLVLWKWLSACSIATGIILGSTITYVVMR